LFPEPGQGEPGHPGKPKTNKGEGILGPQKRKATSTGVQREEALGTAAKMPAGPHLSDNLVSREGFYLQELSVWGPREQEPHRC
jgi:hypothetical protein